jgi:hypothetical protein
MTKNTTYERERERERERARIVPSELNLVFICIIFIMLELFYGIIERPVNCPKSKNPLTGSRGRPGPTGGVVYLAVHSVFIFLTINILPHADCLTIFVEKFNITDKTVFS